MSSYRAGIGGVKVTPPNAGTKVSDIASASPFHYPATEPQARHFTPSAINMNR